MMLLVIILMAHVTQALDIEDLIGVKLTKCEFKCPPGKIKKINKQHTPSTNGCGSQGLQIDVSEFKGVSTCCDEHDLCYDVCNIADRKEKRRKCDNEFSECIVEKCSIYKTGEKRDKCAELHSVMSAGANMFGCPAYQEAQKKACLCVDPENAKEEL